MSRRRKLNSPALVIRQSHIGQRTSACELLLVKVLVQVQAQVQLQMRGSERSQIPIPKPTKQPSIPKLARMFAPARQQQAEAEMLLLLAVSPRPFLSWQPTVWVTVVVAEGCVTSMG